MEYESRDYQNRVVDQVIRHFEAGDRTVMIESPTGSGKTIMAMRVLKHFEDGHGLRSNWVAMRRNLLRQAAETNARFFGLRRLNLVSMFDASPPPADITVVDEAQHDATASCVHIHEAAGARFILGTTATPYRTDRLKLAFRRVVRDAGLHRLIQDGWLCPYRHWSIEAWTPQVVADVYLRERERWGKSVVFFATLAECDRFAGLLAEAGVHCEVVHAGTDRERQLDAFDAGRFDVVANVAILHEGFDCPDLRTVFVRDASRLPTVQMAGRGFRRHPGKPYCNIVQSGRTPWPFTRTAAAQQSFVLRDGRWLSLGGTDAVDRVSREMARRLADVRVELPDLLQRKRSGRPAGPAGGGPFRPRRWPAGGLDLGSY